MESVGGAKISLVRYQYGSMETSSYRNMEELVLHLLTSNGADFVEIVEKKILPEAKRLWQEEDDVEDEQGTDSYWVAESGEIDF